LGELFKPEEETQMRWTACCKILSVLFLAAMVLALTGVSEAMPIPLGGGGSFNIDGLSALVNPACINFFAGTIPDTCPPSSPDTFILGSPADPIFGTVGVTTGKTADFLFSQQSGTTYTGGVGFITLNGFTFDLTSVVVPPAIPCPPIAAPGVCTSADFVLVQVDLNTSGTACPGGTGACGHVGVQFSVNGIGYSGTSATGFTPYTATYTSQFNNETATDLINKVDTFADIENSASATWSPTVVAPEPAGFAVSAAGLMALITLTRRYRKVRSVRVFY
jgi:hypothetical protein